jgi:hypothetical protein
MPIEPLPTFLVILPALSLAISPATAQVQPDNACIVLVRDESGSVAENDPGSGRTATKATGDV